MKTLCMDSAHKHLTIILMEDNNVKGSFSQKCWKRQSENLFPELIHVMENIGWEADDLNQVVITDGPGSYTGVRIAMSVAKVLCTTKHIPLLCLSTLQLYAGINERVKVMLDARSNRAYTALLNHGMFEEPENIQSLDEIKQEVEEKHVCVIGDSSLIHIPEKEINFVQNFADLLPFARPVENIHTLVPHYLKEQDAYKV